MVGCLVRYPPPPVIQKEGCLYCVKLKQLSCRDNEYIIDALKTRLSEIN